jgi:hypothetical protein
VDRGLVYANEPQVAAGRTAVAPDVPARFLSTNFVPKRVQASQHPATPPKDTIVGQPISRMRPSQVPLRPSHFPRPPIQRKQAISSPGGADEREADDLADAILAMPDPAAGPAHPTVQRKCTGCEDEDKEPIKTKHVPSAGDGTASDPRPALAAATHGGVPLPRPVRSYFEQRFGRDFAAVRVHTGPDAAAGAHAVQARAYTIGNEIVFGAHEFAPATSEGKRLLAHELVHTIQQAGTAPQRKIQGAPVAGEGVCHEQPDAQEGAASLAGQGFAPAESAQAHEADAAANDVPDGPASTLVDSAAPGSLIQRQSGSGSPPPRPPSASEVVELKGHNHFDPSGPLGEQIRSENGEEVQVQLRFGKIAQGTIPVFYGVRSPVEIPGMPPVWLPGPVGYQTPEPEADFPGWGIPLHHPAFTSTPEATPMLWLTIRDSVVTGAMGWQTRLGLARHSDKFKAAIPLEKLIGGFENFTELIFDSEVTDELSDGRFVYEVPKLEFESGEYAGTGRLSVVNEDYDLDAGIDVHLAGLPNDARVPVRHGGTSPAETFRATKTWRFERALGGKAGGHLSGHLTATLGFGMLDIRGIVDYQNTDPDLTGRVSIVAGTFDDARDAVQRWLGSDAPADIAPADGHDDGAITGMGQLDFRYSDWLTGSAEVIVHPEGWVTARGELVPPKVITLFRAGHKLDKKKDKPIIEHKTPAIPIVGVPGFADVEASADGKVFGYAWVGPGVLRDLRATGLLSNHPAIISRFDLGGTISAPALAGLALDANASISGHALEVVEVSHVAIHAEALAELQMYSEASAEVGRRASTDPARPEYFVQGDMDASAAVVVKLKLGISAGVLFWEGSKELLDRAWTLGQGGVHLEFELVLGGPKSGSVSTEFTGIDFDSEQFANAVALDTLARADEVTEKTPATALTTSEVTNPDAPEPLGPTASPAGGGIAAGSPPEVDETLDMSDEWHVLRLWIGAEPELVMESTPRALLRRLGRERKRVKASVVDTEMLATQLADLDKIKEQAALVIDAAKKISQQSAALTPAVPGFADLAKQISEYGQRYGVTDLGDVLEPEPPPRPKITRDERATVTVDATIEFDRTPQVKEHFGSQVSHDDSGSLVTVRLPATFQGARGYRKIPSLGGIIYPPDPGSKTLRVRSWNTGDPARLSNSSHAEAQFAEWLTHDADPQARVTSLSLVVRGRSPCPYCAKTLSDLADTLKRRFAGVTLSLAWQGQLYKEWNNDEAKMSSSIKGWTVRRER